MSIAALFPIERFDSEEEFECSRCHRKVSAELGGDCSDVDPNGDLCDVCWCERDRALAPWRFL